MISQKRSQDGVLEFLGVNTLWKRETNLGLETVVEGVMSEERMSWIWRIHLV
ncbi:hypothetical protein KC19_VG258900 [Ceratodon purpureus]|uniref:Uncharacterized protein n=1 Tax=Ceratodon purpureus TaxID=3225 RepID=A0A8T0HTL1_CERPU|nr:hypothetical protein KC19_VG258900 [Ceratodon purpureus]